MVAGGSGCDVCRARASHPEAISVDDDERRRKRSATALLLFGVVYYGRLSHRIISLIIIIISVYDCRASGARPRRCFVL